jgi:ZIP family zinc transporter
VAFAATATEGLPALQHTGSTPAILVDGFLGLTAMFGVKEIGKRFSASWSLIVLDAVDILIDGVVFGIGFAAGEAPRTILATALTAEILFLGGVRRKNFAR